MGKKLRVYILIQINIDYIDTEMVQKTSQKLQLGVHNVTSPSMFLLTSILISRNKFYK